MARLGDICKVVSGTTPKSSVAEYWDGTIKWITPAELTDESYIITDSVRHITDLAVKASGLKPFPAGTVILSSRAPIGKTAIAGCEMYCNQGFKNLICSNQVYNKYLYWYLTCKTAYLNSLGRGATFKEISKEIVENIDIPLPSWDEQVKITEKFEKLAPSIALRKKQLSKLDEFVKSRFIELFGNYNLANVKPGWIEISKIGTVIGGATPKTNNDEFWDGEYRWITPAELSTDSGYIFDSVRKLTKAGVDSCSLQEMPIDTVILSSRAPIGKVALAGNTFYCNQGFKNIICNDSIVPRYLYSLLLFNTDYLNSLGRGATFKEISKSIVENIKIPVPPIDQQKQFAAFVEQTDKLKSEVKQSLEKLETLKKALMQKYFG